MRPFLNLEGDAVAYGKELGGDIYEGKRSLMMIRLMEEATETERDRVGRLLGTPRADRDESEVEWVMDRMNAYDCIDYARHVAHGLAGAAMHEFDRTFGRLKDSRDKRFIEALPKWVLSRA